MSITGDKGNVGYLAKLEKADDDEGMEGQAASTREDGGLAVMEDGKPAEHRYEVTIDPDDLLSLEKEMESQMIPDDTFGVTDDGEDKVNETTEVSPDSIREDGEAENVINSADTMPTTKSEDVKASDELMETGISEADNADGVEEISEQLQTVEVPEAVVTQDVQPATPKPETSSEPETARSVDDGEKVHAQELPVDADADAELKTTAGPKSELKTDQEDELKTETEPETAIEDDAEKAPADPETVIPNEEPPTADETDDPTEADGQMTETTGVNLSSTGTSGTPVSLLVEKHANSFTAGVLQPTSVLLNCKYTTAFLCVI